MIKPRQLKFLSGSPNTHSADMIAHAASVIASRVVDLVPETDRVEALTELLDMLGIVDSDSEQETYAPTAGVDMASIKGYMPKARGSHDSAARR